MSYILEALKQSQQARERGQVPRLDSGLFEPPEPTPRRWPWILLAVCLVAGLVFGLAWRIAPRQDQRSVAVPPAAPAIVSAPLAESPVAASPAAIPDSRAPAAASNVLVVPVPDADGRPLARGAEELRRAALGIDEPAPPPVAQAEASAPIPPPSDLVPADLRAEIEAFKRQLTRATDPVRNEPSVTRQAPLNTLPAPHVDAARAAPPAPGLSARLPRLAMSVHVFDADPQQRFIYLDGEKRQEGESTATGLTVVRIWPDGAELSFEGERFFHAR